LRSSLVRKVWYGYFLISDSNYKNWDQMEGSIIIEKGRKKEDGGGNEPNNSPGGNLA